MEETEQSSTVLTNGLYDKLKFVAQILLPALATLWFTLGSIWNLPNVTEVVGTIAAVDTFLGVVLQLSSRQYRNSGANFDGDVVVTPEDGGNKVVIAFNRPPEDLVDAPGKHSLELKINRQMGVGA